MSGNEGRGAISVPPTSKNTASRGRGAIEGESIAEVRGRGEDRRALRDETARDRAPHRAQPLDRDAEPGQGSRPAKEPRAHLFIRIDAGIPARAPPRLSGSRGCRASAGPGRHAIAIAPG